MDEQADAGSEVERLIGAAGELAVMLGAESETIIRALADIIRRRIAFERAKAELGAGARTR